MKYSISMEVGDDYKYTIYRHADNGRMDSVEVTLGDCIKQWPGLIRNESDALMRLMLTAEQFFK